MIFKFETEKQMTDFDAKVGKYSGSLSAGESSCWIYNEGQPNWFSLQFCGNRWVLDKLGEGKGRSLTFVPQTEQELLDTCLAFSENKFYFPLEY